MDAIEVIDQRVKEVSEQWQKAKAQLDLDALAPQDAEKKSKELHQAFLSKKGAVQSLMPLLKSLSREEKPVAGQKINTLRGEISSSFESLQRVVRKKAMASKLADPENLYDCSLPGPDCKGSLHPITLIRREIVHAFSRLGFVVADGPELDFDFYNFSALNIPAIHPARDMQDTFYLESCVNSGEKEEPMVLRTHTSNVQIHTMKDQRPPMRVIAPGRTYRVDSDPTHTPMFHQVEGFVIDKGISMAHLKGVLNAWVKGMFGSDAQTRLRPSYFPFVEPGAEMDMSCLICVGKDQSCRVCKGTGWLEIGGCGMIHPNVFEAVGIDSEEYSGFAFGFGMDRMAMLKYGLPDLRQLFEPSKDFLSAFPLFTLRPPATFSGKSGGQS